MFPLSKVAQKKSHFSIENDILLLKLLLNNWQVEKAWLASNFYGEVNLGQSSQHIALNALSRDDTILAHVVCFISLFLYKFQKLE